MTDGSYSWLWKQLREERARSGLPEDGSVRTIGRYEIGEVIGRGGMSLVVRAFDPLLRRNIALKIPDENTFARWEREARAMSRLHHPHIAEILDVGEADGFRYIAVELLEGGTLATAWTDWSLRRRVEALAQISAAVACAHGQGILHRDIKPDNILLSADGTLKLVDFGLARIEGEQGVTREGATIGTPLYMSPEQVEGRKAGPPSDVYSLGVMLYEILTGSPPFIGGTTAELYHRIVQETPEVPRSLRTKIPVDLETVCLRCLEKEPARRYPDAKALTADLHAWLVGKQVAARPKSAIRRAAEWVGRRRRPLGAVLGVAIGAFAVILAVSMQSSRHRREQVELLVRQAGASHAANDLESARAAVEEALRLDPAHRGARYWQARIRLRDYQERRGLPDATVSRGVVVLGLLPPEDAELRSMRESMEAAFRDSGDDPFAAAMLALWRGDFEAALRGLEAAPAGDEVAFLRAQCCYLVERFDEAFEILRELAGRLPRMALPLWCRVLIARAMRAEEMGESGEEWLRKAEDGAVALGVAGNPRGAALLKARIRIEGSFAEFRRGGDPRVRLAEAISLLEGRKDPEALLARGDARLTVAETAARGGEVNLSRPAQFLDAIEEYTASLRARASAVAYERRGDARAALRHYVSGFGIEDPRLLTEALSDYEEAVRLGDAPSANLSRAWVRAHIDQGDDGDPARGVKAWEECVAAATAVVERHPKYAPAAQFRAQARRNLATNLRNSGRPWSEVARKGIEDCTQALDIRAGYVDAMVARAGLRCMLAQETPENGGGTSQFDLAHLDVEAALARNPKLVYTYLVQLNLLRDEGHYRKERGQEFLGCFEKMVEIVDRVLPVIPVGSGFYVWRASALRDIGDAKRARGLDVREGWERAIRDALEGRRINPMNTEAYRLPATVRRRLAILEIEAGRDPLPHYRAAVEDLEKLFSLDERLRRTNAAVQFEMATILTSMGQYEAATRQAGAARSFQAAIEAIDRAIEINPRYADYYRIRGRALLGLAGTGSMNRDAVRAAYRRVLDDYDFLQREFGSYTLAELWRAEREEIEREFEEWERNPK